MQPYQLFEAADIITKHYASIHEKYLAISAKNAFHDLFVSDDHMGNFIALDDREIDFGSQIFEIPIQVKEYNFGANATPNSIIINSAAKTLCSVVDEFSDRFGDDVEISRNTPLLVGVTPFEFHVTITVRAILMCKYGPGRKIYNGPFDETTTTDTNGNSFKLQLFQQIRQETAHIIKFADATDRQFYRETLPFYAGI